MNATAIEPTNHRKGNMKITKLKTAVILAIACIGLFSGCGQTPKAESTPPSPLEYNLGYAQGVLDGMSLFNGLYISNGYVQLPNFNTKCMQIPFMLEATNKISIR